jgi:predicted RNase H-like HicB family nuclease
MNLKILVVLEKAENNYSAYAPDIPGCAATGKTADETIETMKQALKEHLEWMAREGDELPEIGALDARFVSVDVSLPEPVTQTS